MNYSAPLPNDQFQDETPSQADFTAYNSLCAPGGERSEKPLDTNTEHPSPYGPLNGLEATLYKAYKEFEKGQKNYVLHNIVKQVLNTASDSVYLLIGAEGTHWKHPNKAGVYEPDTTDRATHVQLIDGSGFERYVPLSMIRKGGYMFDDQINAYRKAMNNECKTHHRVSVKFYRCGACQQLSTAYRPDRVTGGDLTSSDYAYLADNVSTVRVMVEKKKDELYKAYLSGYVHCDSVHLCPTCQPIISEIKAKEVNIAIYEHYKRGGYIALVTYTLHHQKDYTLRKTLNGLTDAMGRLRSGKAWKAFKARHGILYSIDALESTYTESNGHHPHKHTVVFFNKKPDPRLFKKELFPRYKGIFKNMDGFRLPSKKSGIDVKVSLSSEQAHDFFNMNDEHKYGDMLPDEILADMKAVGDYICKGLDVEKSVSESISSGDWNVGTEVSKGHVKEPIYQKKMPGGQLVTGYTPVGLLLKYYFAVKALHDYELSDFERTHYLKQKERFKKLFLEYAVCFFGKPQTNFSNDLKAVYNVKETLQEIVDNEKSVRQETSEINDLGGLEIFHLGLIAKHRLKNRVTSMVQEAYTFCQDGDKIFDTAIRYIEGFQDLDRQSLNIGDDR